MKFRNTLGLILIFIALGLYLALVEVPTAKKKDEETRRSKQVIQFKVENVEEFELIKPSGTLKVRRDPKTSRWNIIEPLAVPGADGVINQLLLTLEEARITRVADEAPKDLAAFGLQDPPLKIALRFKTGDPQTVSVGDASPIGHSTYLQVGGQQRVLLSFIDKSQLNASLNELRSKTLLDFVARDVTAVDLTFEGKAQRFVKKGEHWTLTAPVNGRGDADEISNFLNNIRFEVIDSFIEETPKEVSRYGLAPARLVLNIEAEKAGRSWTLKIGKAHDDHSFYAQRGQPANVVTVSDSLLEILSKNPLSFMDKSLMSFKEADVTAIESREGKETVRVVRDPDHAGQWKFADPEAGSGAEAGSGPAADEVDSATVNTLLLDLQEARIHEFSPVHNLKLFGLHAPQKTLTVFHKDGSRETLQLGNPNKDQQHYFATRNADASVFTLDAATVKKIFRPRNDYKDKKLFKFDPEQVARISIQSPDQTFELNRRDKKWVLVKPQAIDDLKPFVGKDILWTLSNLEYEATVPPKEAEETGLEKPRLTVALHDRQNQSLGQIIIGHQVPGQPLRYSRLAGDPTLYHIKDRTLGEIPDRLNRFQKNEN